MQINLMQNRATREIGTNTPATSANFRKSPSNLTDRSIKNVTAKVITSVERVVGEEHSLYFLKSAVKLLDFKHRKDNTLAVSNWLCSRWTWKGLIGGAEWVTATSAG